MSDAVRYCGAKTRSGGTCKQRLNLGDKRCRFHGGASPQAKRAAALRLAQLIDPAITVLARELVEAESSRDRLRAVENILDRTGYSRSAKIELEDAREILRAKLMELRGDG